jgi:hypothetical protein
MCFRLVLVPDTNTTINQPLTNTVTHSQPLTRVTAPLTAVFVAHLAPLRT